MLYGRTLREACMAFHERSIHKVRRSGAQVQALLGGSWDLVSTVISTLSGVISNYKYRYLN